MMIVAFLCVGIGVLHVMLCKQALEDKDMGWAAIFYCSTLVAFGLAGFQLSLIL